MQRVSNEALSRNPKEVASAIKQTLQKINTPEAKQLAEIINDNDKSNKRL